MRPYHTLLKLFFVAFTISVFIFSCTQKQQVEDNETVTPKKKVRTIVTTDGEVDDIDSFIRYLLLSNEFETLGLVITSSQWHYAGDGKGTKFISELPTTKNLYGERTELRWPGTDWIYEYIDLYEEVFPNLKIHDPDYPEPDYLRSIVKIGNIEFEGEMEKVTDGSEFIKNILLDDDTTQIYLQVWGGTNTIARALKSIEDIYKSTPEWQTIYDKVAQKVVIYTILDQDATYRKYIGPKWPDVKVLYNAAQFWSLAYPWPRVVPEELQQHLDGLWFKDEYTF